jgi:hypothetical protein
LAGGTRRDNVVLATVRLEANADRDNGAALRVGLAPEDVQEVRLMS